MEFLKFIGSNLVALGKGLLYGGFVWLKSLVGLDDNSVAEETPQNQDLTNDFENIEDSNSYDSHSDQ